MLHNHIPPNKPINIILGSGYCNAKLSVFIYEGLGLGYTSKRQKLGKIGHLLNAYVPADSIHKCFALGWFQS